MNSTALKYNVLIAVAAMLLFIPFLGAVHLFDWDEINFAECAREMLVTHDYFSIKINFQPFWEKPPIFIWMQALSMSLFGVTEFAARLPDALCGIITLLVLFNIGRKIADEQLGLIWALVYAGSLLPHFYFKSGIIDPWFNLFIFVGIYYFILYTNSKSNRLILFSALFIGLAVLTKGPVAVLVTSLCIAVYWAMKRFQPIISLKRLVIYALAVAAVGSLWFLMLLITGNAGIIKEFFLYQIRLFNTQDAGHGGPIFYHWVVLLVGCFPVSVFALQGFKGNEHDTPFQKHFKLWMKILFFVVLILFSIVKTKIVHYSSLCYFPLSFLGATVVYRLINKETKWKNTTSVLLIFIGGAIAIAIAALPFIDKYKQQIIDANIIDDTFAIENLKATVYWSGYEWLIGAGFIIAILVLVLFVSRRKPAQKVIGIFLFSLITVNMAAIVIAPRVEQYSQGAAIEFYQYLQDKDCYIETMGFKSYAHLFYSQKKQQTNKDSYNIDWLLRGKVDKPTYIVTKVTDVDDILKQFETLKEIYRKNGFVFLMRR